MATFVTTVRFIALCAATLGMAHAHAVQHVAVVAGPTQSVGESRLPGHHHAENGRDADGAPIDLGNVQGQQTSTSWYVCCCHVGVR